MRQFGALFGRVPTVFADAPGRVNVIGEHTDYNGGFVLPAAIPLIHARVQVAVRDDTPVRAVSTAVGYRDILSYRLGEERPGRGWLDYVQGITHVLAAGGWRIAGFDLRLDSEVPIGAGLSSSAALEVAVLRALRSAFGLALDDVALALVAQRAECDFVGVRAGVMDQMASSLARAAPFSSSTPARSRGGTSHSLRRSSSS
jgi:galactokinase